MEVPAFWVGVPRHASTRNDTTGVWRLHFCRSEHHTAQAFTTVGGRMFLQATVQAFMDAGVYVILDVHQAWRALLGTGRSHTDANARPSLQMVITSGIDIS